MASPMLMAISVIDFLAAILLIWNFPGTFMLVVALVLLAKGVWSIVSSLAEGFYYDIFGFVDFSGAIVLLVVNFGTPVSFAWIIGAAVGGKALYTLLSSI